LSKPDAEKLGIEVSLFNGTPNAKSPDYATATGAYMVQVRPNEAMKTEG
jgi:hypothetical protein